MFVECQCVPSRQLPPSHVNFCRIQSSHCEHADYGGIVDSLDNHLLTHLALGFECRVYDFGSRGNVWTSASGRNRNLFVPRAIWWGLEWVRYALGTVWRLPQIPTPRLRGHDVSNVFEPGLRSLTARQYRRIKWYRPLLAPGLEAVSLRGYHARAATDGDREEHRRILVDEYRHACAAAEPAGGELAVPELELFESASMRALNMRFPTKMKQQPE